jgi:DegV family protein with EDD domain
MIRIAVDSTCDLPDDLYQEYDLTVVPINIQFGTESYRHGIDIDPATFYGKIDELGVLPTTSQPSAGQFETYYNGLAEDGATDIVSLHVTSKLSGTYQSAELAKEMVAERVRVHPFDTASGSAGLGFMAVEASRMAQRGRDVDEILARMEVMRERMNVLLSMKDLRYAQMSGRVGRLQSSLAALLNVKPIVLMEDGLLDVVEQVRTRRKAIERMLDILIERVGTMAAVNLAVFHAEARDEGQDLLEQAKARLNCQETFLVNFTITLVVHFGPGTLGLIAYRV